MDFPTPSTEILPGQLTNFLRGTIAQDEGPLESELNRLINVAPTVGADAIRGFEMAGGSDGKNYVAWLTFTAVEEGDPDIEVPLSPSDVEGLVTAFIVCKSFAGSDLAARRAWDSALVEAQTRANTLTGANSTFNVYVSRWALGGGATVGMLAILCLAVAEPPPPP